MEFTRMNNQLFLNVIYLYLFSINIVLFFTMKLDKRKAIQRKRRISEKNLFFIALAGGAIGGTLGMYYFHHKNRKWYFKYGFSFLALVQGCVFYYFLI